MRFLLFILILALPFSACRQKLKGTAELNEMDSLLAALNRAKHLLDSIDFNEYDVIKSKAKQDILWIQEHVTDTLNRDQSILISNYARIVGKRGLGTASSQTNKQEKESDAGYDNQRSTFIRKEIELCIKQLENLKHDTENKKLETAQVKQFLSEEKSNAQKIITYVTLEKTKSYNARVISDSLGPQIEQFIDSLKMKVNP